MQTNTLINLLALATILVQVALVVVTLGLLTGSVQKLVNKFKPSYQLFLVTAYAFSMVPVVASLLLSDVAGFTPCKMCWYQRVAMYPQAVLYLMGLVNKDKHLPQYGMALSIIGALLALYHYLLQFGIVPATLCSTTGFSISCVDKTVQVFGYITIPMMSLTSFLMIILLWVVYFASHKKVARPTGKNG